MVLTCAMGNLIVVPVRLESTRLPQKALLSESGQPLILHTIERASQSQKGDRLIVATDSQEIFDIVEKAGFQAMMTRTDHSCGTDRVAEVAEQSDAKRIVNVQGDEPFIEPQLIDDMFNFLEDHPEIPMSTAVHPHEDEEDLKSPSQVKVVLDCHNRALYFSRTLIPFPKNQTDQKYWRHIGIYGFQKDYLKKFVTLPQGKLEKTESLEQLRALENGDVIHALETTYSGFSVDTPEEYQQFLEKVK